MRQQSIFITAITALFILFAQTILQAQFGTRGNGDVTKQTRRVDHFDQISVSGGLNLYIRMGSKHEVVVEADENLQELIKTEVKGSQLKLYVEKSVWRSKAMDVYVTVMDLKELYASGGSDVYSKGIITANDFELRASGGSDVHLDLDVDRFTAKASGGSDTKLRGTINRANLQCSGGSDFDGRDATISYAKINTSGGSDSHIKVTKEVEINASGASDVYLYGNPKILSKNVSGGADFHQRSK